MRMLAKAYERQLALERAALTAALELADAQPDDRMLDVATGTGALLRELARRDLRPAEVVGIDRWSSALVVAATRLPTGWRLISGDARWLPFPDGHFDLVSACYLLHLLAREDRHAVLLEIARVLRPGGRVVTVTVQSHRAATRAGLGLLPRASGLRPLDPIDDLAAAGLVTARARFVSAGWPSWCVLAIREPGHAARARG